MSKALVIFSGGQDSTTCLYWAKKHFDEVHLITFDYGQRHIAEIEAAVKISELAQPASMEIVHMPQILVSTSPLTSDAELDKYKNNAEMEAKVGDKIEKTFVPMRNMLFFTIAMNRAVALGCNNLITGICGEDNANYPDCTASFRALFERTANESLGEFANYHIHAPLMTNSKADTVRMAWSMPECWKALAYSHTSYDGKYPPTDNNHSNILRAQGFLEAGLPDPLVVRAVCEGVMERPTTPNYKDIAFDMTKKIIYG